MNKFLASELEETTPEQCRFQVVPVPFEATVSYGGGTAEGPRAILEASDQLELWDGESIPANEGIYTHEAVDCTGPTEQVLARIEAAISTAAEYGMPVMLGGEHSVTLGALRALKKKYGTFGIVQFDAHADLRKAYEGNPYSHASVMHRALELELPVFQLGVRAFCTEEVAVRAKHNIPHIDAKELALSPLPDTLLPDGFPENIYITFDVDGLDPSVIRATGTPVPGGIQWWQAITLLEKAVKGRNVVGCDVVELAPQEGDHASDFAAAQLTYSMLGIIQRSAK
ncbi:agmatinase [Halodesulfovibrio aestuarii]|uniref:Agmatinase n=2 Tax=Halodesulfovibrio aestuarii TaxID=126333 RepID=A0ABV4JNV5_9BACT